MTDLYRLASHGGDGHEAYKAARVLEDRVWSVCQALRDRVERGEPLELGAITLEGFPDDVRRRFV